MQYSNPAEPFQYTCRSHISPCCNQLEPTTEMFATGAAATQHNTPTFNFLNTNKCNQSKKRDALIKDMLLLQLSICL